MRIEELLEALLAQISLSEARPIIGVDLRIGILIGAHTIPHSLYIMLEGGKKGWGEGETYLNIYYEELLVGMLISEVAESLRRVAFVRAHITAVVIKFTIYSLHIYYQSQTQIYHLNSDPKGYGSRPQVTTSGTRSTSSTT